MMPQFIILEKTSRSSSNRMNDILEDFKKWCTITKTKAMIIIKQTFISLLQVKVNKFDSSYSEFVTSSEWLGV